MRAKLAFLGMPGTHGSGCGCQHENEVTGEPFLLEHIDVENVRGLNCISEKSAQLVFRSFDKRLDEDRFCRSESGDPEIIVHIPFRSPCKLSGLRVIGGDDGAAPKTVRVFADQEDLDFTSIEDAKEVQKLSLVEDFHGSVEYPLKVTKLLNVSSLALHFTEPFSADFLKVHWIAIQGTCAGGQRRAVATVYESRPNIDDHSVRGDENRPHWDVT
eukprot:Polyplicarium_translucidae@DN2924_c0_g2_i1.p4